jgi:DNA-binding NtrC family response regulator
MLLVPASLDDTPDARCHMTSTFDIMVLSSEPGNRRYVADILAKLGFDPVCASTLNEYRENLGQEKVGLIFCDAHFADGTYQDVISACRQSDSKPKVVVMSRTADWGEFKEAMRSGAFDMISAPCRPMDVEWMVIQARRQRQPVPARAAELAKAARTGSF